MDTAKQSQRSPKPIVVVGLGNEIAGDDGAGIVAAGKLAVLLAADPVVEVITLPWAGFALLDVIVGRHQAVIIDCLTSGVYPVGTVVRLDEHNFQGSVRLNSFHDINYPTALDLGRRLGWPLPESIVIWAIEGQRVNEFTDQLTPAVAAAVDRVVRKILQCLRETVIPTLPSKGHVDTGAAGSIGLLRTCRNNRHVSGTPKPKSFSGCPIQGDV